MGGRLSRVLVGVVLLLMLLLFLTVFKLPLPARAEGPWSTFDVGERYDFTTVTVGDRVLIGGGRHSDVTTHRTVYDDEVHIYDGRCGTWSTARLSTSRASAIGVMVGDLGLFIGGIGPGDAERPGERYSDIVDVYDSVHDSWSAARLSFTDSVVRVTVVGSQVLIAGTSAANHGKVDVFDSVTRSISPMPSAPPDRGGTRIVTNGVMLVLHHLRAPGIWDVDEPIELYDSTRGAWSMLSLPTPRRRVGVAVAGSMIVFAGGEVEERPVDTVEIYDTRSRDWSRARLSAPSSTAAGLTVGQRALFFGDTVDVFDAATCTWSTTTPPVPLRGVPTIRGTVVVWPLTIAWSESDPGPEVAIYDAVHDVWHTGKLSEPRANYSIATAGNRVLFAGGGQDSGGGRRTPNVELTVVDVYDLTTGAWSQGQLQRGRESMRTATVAEKALFIGGILGCNSCPIGYVGLIVDIYDAATAG